jgi:hypothetical protein
MHPGVTRLVSPPRSEGGRHATTLIESNGDGAKAVRKRLGRRVRSG